MPELLDETSHLESTTVRVFRTSTTVKGGRRFSFGALVVVGDRRGRVGYAHGKSREVPAAIEKAQKHARRGMLTVPLVGRTIPHEVEGRYGASKVRLVPASPGTGVAAGGSVRAILELAGVSDCLTKCYGSTNSANVVKAAFDALARLRLPRTVSELRGVEVGTTAIEEKIARAGSPALPGSADADQDQPSGSNQH
jgi:small subunit ribosomal protein S5